MAKHLGLYEKDNEQKNDPLQLKQMTDAERAVRLAAVFNGSSTSAALITALLARKGEQ